MTFNPQALIIGTTLIDIYFIGEATRLDQTAPVPVINASMQVAGVGGAANTALSMARLGLPTKFVTVLGEGNEQVQVNKVLDDPNLQLCPCQIAAYKHPIKTRIYAKQQLVARFDTHTDELKVEDHVCDMFTRAATGEQLKVILISDYGNAVVTAETLNAVFNYARENNVPVVVDPAVKHMPLYKNNCYIMTPSRHEVCEYAKCDDPVQAAHKVYDELRPKYLLLTLGAQGMMLFDETLQAKHYPALPALARSSCGCGDAVAAAVSYAVSRGMDIDSMVQYANAAGAAAVESFGAKNVSAHEVMRKMLFYKGAAGKVITFQEAMRIRQSVKADGLRFGVTNGVFDLLHVGHMDMLHKAHAECDFLLCLVNSDESATSYKRTPVNSEDLRTSMLANLQTVDAVTMFYDAAPTVLIEHLEPDVLIKGPDWAAADLPEAEYIIKQGGRFVSTTKAHDVSTTQTIKQITDNGKESA